MEIRLPLKFADQIIRETNNEIIKNAKDAGLRTGMGMANSRSFVVNGALLDKATLKFMRQETKDQDNALANVIEFLYKAAKNPSNIKVKSMKDVEVALRQYLHSANLKNYLFERGSHKTLLPYVITDLKSNASDRLSNSRYASPDERVITVSVYLAYDSGAQLETSILHYSPRTLESIFIENDVLYTREDVTVKKNTENEYTFLRDVKSETGVPVEMLLRHYNKYLETEELHEQLEKQLTNYFKYVKMYGQQFRVRGTGESDEASWYSSSSNSMMIEGKPGRVIMNTVPSAILPETEEESAPKKSYGYYGGGYARRNKRRQDNESQESGLPNSPTDIAELFAELNVQDMEVMTKTDFIPGEKGVEIVAPMHPKLRVFHLTKMENFWVHVNNLIPYKYKENIADQLILDAETKELVQMLVVNSADDMEDVMEGKTQSTIIAAVGDPGLGKTLMCEVMSEACQKPLYKVQAAQLGLTAEALEENLQRILNQAQRWNSILMIDEANAYIHARGHDIRQNAIVGVFLRLLDYYKGVLVLTTNMTSTDPDVGMDFDIDPAITNRCTAVIKFELPSKKLARDLWLLQGSLRGIKFVEDHPELLKTLVNRYQISGRTIRNLLKMAANWAAHKEETLDVKHFELAAKFVPMSNIETARLAAKAKEAS